MMTLDEIRSDELLQQGNPSLLAALRPVFRRLIIRLLAQGSLPSEEKRDAAFAEAFEKINFFQDDIGTTERETILGAVYRIGSAIGLPETTQFAEKWRGDW
jgi:hypothetical protein